MGVVSPPPLRRLATDHSKPIMEEPTTQAKSIKAASASKDTQAREKKAKVDEKKPKAAAQKKRGASPLT